MKADRDPFEPAVWSISARRSDESVMDVYSFMLPLYYFFQFAAKSYSGSLVSG